MTVSEMYRVIQNKMSEHKSGNIYVVEEYFHIKFSPICVLVLYLLTLAKWSNVTINVKFSLINSLLL